MINYGERLFRPVRTEGASQTDQETLFRYSQLGNRVTATYSGGSIAYGHLLGLVDENGVLEMRYHQVDVEGELRTGVCTTTPEVLKDGKLRLHERWRWTCGDGSSGSSTLEEI
jgi:hypothetical protein